MTEVNLSLTWYKNNRKVSPVFLSCLFLEKNKANHIPFQTTATVFFRFEFNRIGQRRERPEAQKIANDGGPCSNPILAKHRAAYSACRCSSTAVQCGTDQTLEIHANKNYFHCHLINFPRIFPFKKNKNSGIVPFKKNKNSGIVPLTFQSIVDWFDWLSK